MAMADDSFSHNIRPERMYKLDEVDWLFNDRRDRRIAERLINAGAIPRQQGKISGQSLLSVMNNLRHRVVVLKDVAQELGIDPSKLSELLDAGDLRARSLETIGQGPNALYLLTAGVTHDTFLQHLRSTQESGKKQQDLAMGLHKLCRRLGLPRERFRLAMEAGILDQYLQVSAGHRDPPYTLQSEEQREPLMRFLRRLAKARTFSGLAAQLRYDLPTFSLLLPTKKRDTYLEPLVERGDDTLYVFRKGVTMEKVLTYLRTAEPHLKKRIDIRSDLSMIQRLMFLQRRYPTDMAYAGGVEFLLQGHAQLEQHDPDGLQELEHRQLQGMLKKLSGAMSSSEVKKAQAFVQQLYSCSLEGLLDTTGEDVPPSEYHVASPEGVITVPRLSGRFGLDPEVLRKLLAGRTGIREIYLDTIGGDKRQPQYQLQEGKSVEDFARDLLIDYEKDATRRITRESSSRPGSDHRVLFHQGRWAEDHLFDAKVNFWYLGDPHARLRNGHAAMNLLDREILHEMVTMTKEHLPPKKVGKIEENITLVYGEEWKR